MIGRVFYFAPVGLGRGAKGQGIPAVRNKVLGVCGAIRAGGMRPVVVSTVTGNGDVSPTRPLRAVREAGIGGVQVFSFGRAGVRRLVSALFLMWAAMRVVRRPDRVILYNSFPEYILAAAWLRLAGRTCIIDIEDAPRRDEPGARGLMNRWSFAILAALTTRRYITVSHELGRALGLKDYLPIYGVASHFQPNPKRPKPFSQKEVRIHLGGALLRDTGSELFVEALRHLARDHGSQPIHFFVTGHFKAGVFDEAQREIEGASALQLTVAADLDNASYRALLDTMDVGLCLKLPSSAMGQTTFPSKVVEIASMGLLLVSTQVSDVPLIFDDGCARLLALEDGGELARTLARLPDDRMEAAKSARLGQQRVAERFSKAAVGQSLKAFLDR